MASTGINNGTITTVYVGGVAIAHSTSCSLSVGANTRDASTKSSAGWEEVLTGQKNWSISFEGFFAEDAAYGFDNLFAAVIARTALTIKYSSEVSGDKYYTGTAYPEGLEREDGLEESSTFSCTFKGTGALTEATV